MARLQRKKKIGGKKKSQIKKTTSSDMQNSAVAKKSAMFEGATRDSGKRKALAQKKILSISKTKSQKQKKNYFNMAVQFLREVKVELKKVTWPSRKQTLGSTLVVIILVMIISLFLGVVDVGLSGIIRAVLQ